MFQCQTLVRAEYGRCISWRGRICRPVACRLRSQPWLRPSIVARLNELSDRSPIMKSAHRRVVLVGAAMLACVGVGIGVDRVAFAQQPGIKRTILLRADDPSSAKYEAVMAIAEIAPGAMSGRHRHPGIEVAYILDGSVIIERDGQ